MDTNAVYIAWGQPSEVRIQPSPVGTGASQTWIYYSNRPALTPRWVYIPGAYGRGTLDYSPIPYSVLDTKAQVTFENGRVVDWIARK